MKSMISLRLKLGVSILSLCMFFGMAEATLRLVGTVAPGDQTRNLPLWVISNIQSQFLVPDPLRFWKLPAGAGKYGINSLGMLGEEVRPEKEPDVFRIICLGDSITFGFGVHSSQTFAHRLQRLLNDTRTPVVYEVWNAGVPGYSSLQGRRYFHSELAAYEPDVVTVCFGRNDSRFLHQEGGYLPDREVRIQPAWITGLRGLMNHSRIYQFLRAGFITVRRLSVETPDQLAQVSRVTPKEFRENIDSLLDEITARGATPVLLTAPVRLPRIGNYNDILRDVAATRGLILVDTERSFNEIGNERLLVDDCHPNPLGHEYIAGRLFRAMSPLISERFHLAPGALSIPDRGDFTWELPAVSSTTQAVAP
ncbi:SGNH/GDSL hydrolase family protein [bacterium]|nr:SGNH/GDSL hydrolase family protein [candidate division CSSED10-310 bacterium]